VECSVFRQTNVINGIGPTCDTSGGHLEIGHFKFKIEWILFIRNPLLMTYTIIQWDKNLMANNDKYF